MEENVFKEIITLNPFLNKVCQSLNYSEFSDIQLEVMKVLREVPQVMENYAITSLAGTGKTFSYLLFCLNSLNLSLKKLQILIVLPTRELALQTADYFNKINSSLEEKIDYKFLIGGFDINQDKYNTTNSRNYDTCQVVIGTLGKLNSFFNKKFDTSDLKYLVIDEADKMIFQNKNNLLKNFILKFFSEKNKTIKSFKSIKTNCIPKMILISASIETHSIDFYKKIIQADFKIITSSGKEINQTNLNSYANKQLIVNNLIKEYYYIFHPERKSTYFEQKYTQLFNLLNKLNKEFKQCLIFYNQKGRGEELAADFRELGWSTSFIHADLNQDQRLLIYEKIKNFEVKIIIATDLFSRGIDLSTVDLVINFDSPFNETEYFHRVGRTGRYNSYGLAVSFFQENENELLEKIKSKDSLGKMIEINNFNIDVIENLKDDLKNVKNYNVVDQNIIQKSKLLDNHSLENQETEKFMNTKRRRQQYNGESLVSDWVDLEQELFDSSSFKYYDEEQKDKCEFCIYCRFFKIFESGLIN
jgi:superfamily II DNA/RNA helicase